MTDTATVAGGRSPTNFIAGNEYNPIAGSDFPIGTPVAQSLDVDHTVVPARANSADTTYVTGIASGIGVADNRVITQTGGVLTLTEAQWDQVTGDTGGLVRGVPYYLSSGFSAGQLTATVPVAGGTFAAQVGLALSSRDLLIQICHPIAN